MNSLLLSSAFIVVSQTPVQTDVIDVIQAERGQNPRNFHPEIGENVKLHWLRGGKLKVQRKGEDSLIFLGAKAEDNFEFRGQFPCCSFHSSGDLPGRAYIRKVIIGPVLPNKHTRPIWFQLYDNELRGTYLQFNEDAKRANRTPDRNAYHKREVTSNQIQRSTRQDRYRRERGPIRPIESESPLDMNKVSQFQSMRKKIARMAQAPRILK